ncbi:hypothetical protein F5884DRAFT_888529 [Xylogone sp. PMI_703]|nr:hypothetical protein F5884DRAFT_888529 [Xylogone sp. PMI_703]
MLKAEPPGVRLISKDPEKNAVALAGYLHFLTGTTLREFCARPEVSALIDNIQDAKSRNFNIPQTAQVNVSNKGFHAVLRDLKESERAILEPRDIRIAYLSYILISYRLIALLGNEHAPSTGDDRVSNISIENWNRGYALAKFCLRERSDSRSKMNVRAPSAVKDLAIAPKYLEEKDFARMVDADANDTTNTENDFNSYRDHFEEQAGDEDSDQEWEETLDNVDVGALEETEKLFMVVLPSAVNHSTSRGVRSQRAKLTLKEASDFCNKAAASVSVLWGEDDIAQMRRQSVATDAGDGGEANNVSEVITLGTMIGLAEEAHDGGLEEKVNQSLLHIKETMPSNSAELPSYLEACQWAGLDPHDPQIRGSIGDKGESLQARFWQPQTAYFMHHQEQTTYRTSIIALDCGLGKILSSLLFVKSSNEALQREMMSIPAQDRQYRATLVVVPAQSIEVWFTDKERFYPDSMPTYQFYGNSKKVTSRKSNYLIDGDGIELDKFLKELDPTDPKTGETLIITAYQTWWSRTLGTTDSGNISKYHGASVQTPDDEMPEGVAHIIRNPQTLVSEGIRQINRLNTHFLTATPLLNHSKDLRGFLSLIWNPDWALAKVDKGFLEAYDPEFNPQFVKVPKDNAEEMAEVHSLVPTEDRQQDAFLAAIEKGDKGNWSPQVAAIIIPPVLRMLQLRLTMASKVSVNAGQAPRRVGQDVPPCHIYTIQLEMAKAQQKLYTQYTRPVLKRLYTRDRDPHSRIIFTDQSPEQAERLIDPGVHRYLMHTTLDLRLAKLTKRNRDRSSKVKNSWIESDMDYGASYYFVKTRHGPEYLIPPDRLGLATYMSAESPKVKYVLGKVGEWVLKNKEKAIIVFEYPMSQWVVESQLLNLGFKIVSLRSSMSQEERTKAIKEFNEAGSAQILLFNTKLGSQSLNVHHHAHKIICCEIPINIATFIQVVSRICHIGQNHAQTVYLLWLNHSYDQIVLHRLARKFVSSLAGEDLSNIAREHITKQAEETLRQFLGLQYSTYHRVWGSKDYDDKDEWINEDKDNTDSETEVIITPSTLHKIGKAPKTPQKSLSTNIVTNSISDSQNEQSAEETDLKTKYQASRKRKHESKSATSYIESSDKSDNERVDHEDGSEQEVATPIPEPADEGPSTPQKPVPKRARKNGNDGIRATIIASGNEMDIDSPTKPKSRVTIYLRTSSSKRDKGMKKPGSGVPDNADGSNAGMAEQRLDIPSLATPEYYITKLTYICVTLYDIKPLIEAYPTLHMV